MAGHGDRSKELKGGIGIVAGALNLGSAGKSDASSGSESRISSVSPFSCPFTSEEMKNILRWLVSFRCYASFESADVPTKAATSVAVIAPSVSTSMMARSIIVQKKWIETSQRWQILSWSSLEVHFSIRCASTTKAWRSEARCGITVEYQRARFHIYLYRLDERSAVHARSPHLIRSRD